MGVEVGVSVDVDVGVLLGVDVGVSVGVDVDVSVGVEVGVLVGVSVGVDDGVSVGVEVGVSVGVAVAVFVGVLVGTGVSVGVCVAVGVSVGVSVGVNVGVFVGVDVGVLVGVDVDVCVAVGVLVGGIKIAVKVNVTDSITGVWAESLVDNVTRYWIYSPFGLAIDPLTACQFDQVTSGVGVTPLRVSKMTVVPVGAEPAQVRSSQSANWPAANMRDSNVQGETYGVRCTQSAASVPPPVLKSLAITTMLLAIASVIVVANVPST